MIDERRHSIHDPIKRNSLALFKNPRCKTTSKLGRRSKCLNNVALFGQLYVSMQNLNDDLAQLFAVLLFFPLILWQLHLPSTKSDLLMCLEQPGQPEPLLTHDCKFMDGAVIVRCLQTSVGTFHEYADTIFIPFMEKQLQSATRLDVVTDIIHPGVDSAKESSWANRGKGVRRKVSDETKLDGLPS